MNHRPENLATLDNRPPQGRRAQAAARLAFVPGKPAPGRPFSASRSRANTVWMNTLALTAVAVAIVLLFVKNRDRNPSNQLPKISSILEASRQPKANR